MVIYVFNNKYGDEGLTILFNEEISKASDEIDFLGALKELNAYIKLAINYFNPFKYYFINDSLSKIIETLNKIEKDYSLNLEKEYNSSYIIYLEEKIDELKIKLANYENKDHVINKLSALIEIIYTKSLRLERCYYKLNKEYKFQSYLNRLNDYFYLLKDYVNKEM